jgi:hypothetical protein
MRIINVCWQSGSPRATFMPTPKLQRITTGLVWLNASQFGLLPHHPIDV